MVASEFCPDFSICFRTSQCWDADLDNSLAVGGFLWALAFFVSGIFFVVIAEIGGRTSLYQEARGFLNWKVGGRSREAKAADFDDDDADDDYIRNKAFVLTKRTESNFIKSNGDLSLQLPNPYFPEYHHSTNVAKAILPVSGFFVESWREAAGSNLFVSIHIGSMGWALICSGLSTLLWIIVYYEDACGGDVLFRQWLAEVSASFTEIRRDYAFYPVFLLVGYIGFVVSRWREFMVNCHTVQAELHNVAVLCGGAVLGCPNEQIRKKLYRIYRYINLIHALCYKSVSPSLGGLDVATDFVDVLGLLEENEVIMALAMENKMRDAVITWLSSEIAEFLLMEGVNDTYASVGLANAITGVRGITARHHDLFIRDNPNLYLYLMILVVNTFMLMVVISYPFSLLVHTPETSPLVPYFQPVVLLGVFTMISTFRTAYSLVARIRNPFSWTRDRIKVDNLMASTDRAVFTLLRGSFRGELCNNMEEGQRKEQPLDASIRGGDTRRMGMRRKSVSLKIFTQLRPSLLRGEVLFPVEDSRDI